MPPLIDRRFRKARLCAGLSVALAVGFATPPALAGVVQNCGDGGPGSGSLRDVIANAQPGDAVDLSQLPVKCGMADSVITLWNGEIAITQNDLKLQGPSAGSVTIKAAPGGMARVLDHTGTGVLVLNDLGIADGNAQGPYGAVGGCVYSRGSVFLTRSTVTNCIAGGAYVYGGGIGARGTVILLRSTVSGNEAIGLAEGRGGGIYAAGGISLSYSELRDNHALDGGGAFTFSFDPGIYSHVSNSTIEGNTAERCGGAGLYTQAVVDVRNSTISGNTAHIRNGGLCARGDMTIANTTIAYNTGADVSGGLYAWDGSLALQSSIIAKNGTNPAIPDLYFLAQSATGSDNLVMSVVGNVPPGIIKIMSDPKLAPLQYNGGPTRTHALLRNSPAIGAGNDAVFSWWDQRGPGYPRMTGVSYLTDIGAFQFDSIFASDFQW